MTAVAEFQLVFDGYLARYLAGDAVGCASYYVSDGAIFSPFGPPVKGFDAIAATHAEWFEEGEINKTIVVEDARIEGGVGFCLARYGADVPQEGGGVVRETGTSLNTFLQGADGIWKIWHSSLNATKEET